MFVTAGLRASGVPSCEMAVFAGVRGKWQWAMPEKRQTISAGRRQSGKGCVVFLPFADGYRMPPVAARLAGDCDP
jgi:hypothetical protein